MKRPTQQRRGNPRGRARNGERPPVDVWQPGAAELPPVEAVVQSSKPAALVSSLGDPPLPDGTGAGHYFGSVVERAAAIAAALALSVDLLADPAAPSAEADGGG